MHTEGYLHVPGCVEANMESSKQTGALARGGAASAIAHSASLSVPWLYAISVTQIAQERIDQWTSSKHEIF